MMKKIIICLLCVFLMIGFAACMEIVEDSDVSGSDTDIVIEDSDSGVDSDSSSDSEYDWAESDDRENEDTWKDFYNNN